MKEELRTFDDLDMELNETLIRIFSTMLGVKRNLVCVDREQWAKVVMGITTKRELEKYYEEIDQNFGHANVEYGFIWLNPRLLKRNYMSLVTTIVHEVIHCAHPKWDEDQVFQEERKLTGRYDYTPNYRLGYD